MTPIAWAAQAGDVILNEVAWMGTNASASDEWIELHNPTSQAINLSGWTLAAADGSPSMALSGTIQAGGFFLLERTDDNTVSDVPADQIYSGSLSNGGDALLLRDGANTLIDSANGDGGGWPAGDNAGKLTMERIDPLAAGGDGNWADHRGGLQNGLDANGTPIHGTPKARNSVTNQSPGCTDADLNAEAGVSLDFDLEVFCNDPDGDALNYQVSSGPNHGSLNCTGPTCVYVPDPGFTGKDGFTFQAEDPFGERAGAVVTLDVQPPADPSSDLFFVGGARGSDLNDGRTPTTPLATIQAGVDRVAPGGRVVVVGGTFFETVAIHKNLTLEATGAATLRGGGGVAITVNAGQATVRGFSIEGAAVGVEVLAGSGHVRLEKNALVGNGTGLLNHTATPVDARNNWWGCNAGPNRMGCDTTAGAAVFDPWLVVTLQAVPNPVPVDDTAFVILDVARNSQGQIVSNPLSRLVHLETDRGAWELESPPVWGWLSFMCIIPLIFVPPILGRWLNRSVLFSAIVLAFALFSGCGLKGNVPLESHPISDVLVQGVVVLKLSSPVPGRGRVRAVVDAQHLALDVRFVFKNL